MPQLILTVLLLGIIFIWLVPIQFVGAVGVTCIVVVVVIEVLAFQKEDK